MRRRDFITRLGSGAFVWPLAAYAQQAPPRRIAVLHSGSENPLSLRLLSVFREALLQQGWTEGKNIHVEYRFGNNDPVGRLPLMARELVELQPEVIVTVAAPASLTMRRLTQTIPIVFAGVGDPLGAGLVSNLARPDGNVTGFAVSAAASSAKRLELLKEISPGISRASLMFNPDTTTYRGTVPLSDFFVGAKRLVIDPIVAEVRNQAEIAAAIDALAREPKGGLVVGQDNFMNANRTSIIALVAQLGVPTIYPFNFFTHEGGLMSYGADVIDGYRLAAGYVNRILKGDKPADLPVQQPTKFELVINLKTAAALGLTVPTTLLARANEVIE